MVSSIIMRAAEVRSLAFGGISGVYAQVGPAIKQPVRLLIIQNFTDGDLMISFDGSVDHIPIKASSSFILDLSSNKITTGGYFVEVGTKMHVKQITAPTEGSIYISSLYGKK